MQVPETKFAGVGRDRIAYQVFGDGPGDPLVLGPAWVSVDAQWENVSSLRMWRVLAERFRVVMLDHRGFGMSDPLDETSIGDPAVCVGDELAVLDALGMERVGVLGEHLGALNAVTLAATHPDRVDRLALMNGQVTGLAFGSPPAEVDAVVELTRDVWGTGAIIGGAPTSATIRHSSLASSAWAPGPARRPPTCAPPRRSTCARCSRRSPRPRS